MVHRYFSVVMHKKLDEMVENLQMRNDQPLEVNSKADHFGIYRNQRNLKLRIYSLKLTGKRKKIYKQSLILKPKAVE